MIKKFKLYRESLEPSNKICQDVYDTSQRLILKSGFTKDQLDQIDDFIKDYMDDHDLFYFDIFPYMACNIVDRSVLERKLNGHGPRKKLFKLECLRLVT